MIEQILKLIITSDENMYSIPDNNFKLSLGTMKSMAKLEFITKYSVILY